MQAIGFLAGLVVGVIFLTETCPHCEQPDCERAVAPLPLISPQGQVHTPPLPDRPDRRPRPLPRVAPNPEPGSGPLPCPDRGWFCWLLNLQSPEPAPGPSPVTGFDSFFEELSDNH